MAEIKIEKKKPVWPWLVLGVFIIGLTIIYLLANNDNDREDAVVANPESTEAVQGNEPDAVLTTYYVLIESDPDSMDISHEFTNEALTGLIQATSYTASKNNFDIHADLDSAQRYADVIKKEPFETSHANKIQKAANILTTALVNLQQSKYPGLTNEANEVKAAASRINPEVLTLEQKAEVKTFFREAKDLLREMNR